jgi:hypothetical protein
MQADGQTDVIKLVVALHNFVLCLRSFAIVKMQGLQIVILQVNCKSTVVYILQDYCSLHIPVNGVSGQIK